MRLPKGIYVATAAAGIAFAILVTPLGQGVEALLGPPETPACEAPPPGSVEGDFAVPSVSPDQVAKATQIVDNNPQAQTDMIHAGGGSKC
jgi:hypothetical protein